jgi:hypothetical protein
MNTDASVAEDLLEARARRRGGIRMGFYIHAFVFVLVNGGLWLIDLAGGGPRWAVFPMLGWGVGLAVHGIVAIVSLRGEGFRERMLQREIEALRKRGG